MTEQKHFKNALITFYRRGMRIIKDYGGTGTILVVHSDGDARCCPDLFPNSLWLLKLTDISDYELDWSSIWEEREYRVKLDPDKRATVRLVNDTHVGFVTNNKGWSYCWPKEQFESHFEPVPVDAECPCAGVSEPAAEAEPEPVWQPQAGTECWYEEESEEPGAKVFVIHLHDDEAWIENDTLSRLVNVNCLRPLPLAPPVKMGDIWVDKAYRTHWFVNLTGENPWTIQNDSENNWGGEGGPSDALNPACHKCVGNIGHLIPRSES